MPKTIKLFMQDAQNRPLVYLVQAVGLLVVILNLWLGSKLYPLAQNINQIATRVEAIEKRNENVDPLVTRFIQLEERDKTLVEDVAEIKQDIRDIKNFLNIR